MSWRSAVWAGAIASVVVGANAAIPLVRCAGAAEPQRWSDSAGTLFGSLDATDGLPNLTVNAVAQDSNGFIWAGTSEGVARWDGHHLRAYRPDPLIPGTLIGSQVLTLHTDRQGQLWAGSSAGELSRYDSVQDRFMVVDGGRTSSGNDDVHAIIDDGAGGLWVGRHSGLYHLASGVLDKVQAAGHDPAGLPGVGVAALLLDRQGALWASTQSGLFRQSRGGGAWDAVRLAGGVPAPAVRALLQDSAGRVWAGTLANGAYVVTAEGNVARPVESPGPLPTADVESLAESPDGRIWMGTNGLGILSVDPDTWQVRRIRQQPGHLGSLPDDTVQQVFRDRSGLMWAATDNGLSHTFGRQDAILTVFNGGQWRNPGSWAPDVTAVLPMPDGRILLGTRHSWLTVLDPDGARSLPPPPEPKLQPRIVRGIALTPAGQVLIASPDGLFRADRNGRSVVRIPVDTGHGPLPLLSVTLIGDTYWLAGIDGLWRLAAGSADLPPTELAAAIRKDPVSAKLQDGRGRVVAQAPHGQLWVGTYSGLNLVDPVAHAVQPVSADPADPDGLPEGMVSTLLTDRQGRLWVGTEGGGIAIMTGRNGGRMRFHRLGRKDGLPDQVVDRLLQDTSGTIWASTDGGIASIDPQTFRIRAFGPADGAAIKVYWASAGAITGKGEVLFGGADGMTVIRPDRIPNASVMPSLVVTELTAGGVPDPGFGFRPEGVSTQVVIVPDHNSLEVAFTALDYADPDRYTYAHFLQGVDHGWVTTDSQQRIVAYTNLPPGRFVLQLRATRRLEGGDGGQVIEATLRLPLHVLRAWYETRLFQAAMLILAASALAALLRVQALFERRRQSALQLLVAQRTSQLSIAADTLRDLATIGQEITASVDIETVFAVLRRHVGGLFDAPLMAVHSAGVRGEAPKLRLGLRDGQILPPGTALGAALDSLIERAARDRLDIVVDAPDETMPASYASLLAAPLIVRDHVTGTIAIGSHRQNAYGERERRIIRTLAAYAAIAFSNADTLAELAQAQAQLHRMAYSDGLTGLPNRRVFEEQFTKFVERARRARTHFALVLIDLDHFKQINDSHGHDAGDALLLETAQRLLAVVRAGDLVVRLGGDEFAVLLAGLDSAEAVDAACERILQTLCHTMPFGERVVGVTASIGVALYPRHGEVQADLYKSADMALYQAKAAGRNGWRTYAAADQT